MLVSKGYEVTVLNRGNKKLEKTAQLIADRNVPMDMEKASLLIDGFDAVIDTSAYTLTQAEIAWRYFSPKTPKWIHISSGAVYKNYQTDVPHPETDETGGAEVWGTYGSDKSAIDDFLATRRGSTGTIILRPPYIYGPNNDVDRETFIWARAEAGLSIITPAKDNTPMQFLHVEDLADSICECLDHTFDSNVIYNVAADEIISIRDWVALMLDVCTRKRDTIVLRNTLEGYIIRDYFPFRDSPVCLDAALIKEHLNWRPKYSLRDGFVQTYATRSAEELEKYLKKRSVVESELAAILT
jgi:nucleoside-diphosphate-sugar epimerase